MIYPIQTDCVLYKYLQTVESNTADKVYLRTLKPGDEISVLLGRHDAFLNLALTVKHSATNFEEMLEENYLPGALGALLHQDTSEIIRERFFEPEMALVGSYSLDYRNLSGDSPTYINYGQIIQGYGLVMADYNLRDLIYFRPILKIVVNKAK